MEFNKDIGDYISCSPDRSEEDNNTDTINSFPRLFHLHCLRRCHQVQKACPDVPTQAVVLFAGNTIEATKPPPQYAYQVTIACDAELKEPVVTYLKNLRELGDSHFEVNKCRSKQEVNPITSSCQLVSRKETRIRVLDIPRVTLLSVVAVFCLCILLLLSGDIETNPGPTNSTEKANFGDLVTMPDVDAQWEALGAVLRLDRGSLAQIKAKHGGNPLKCKRDMYRLVVKRGVTWRDVIKALCDVGLPAVARSVCETYDIFPNGLSSYISRFEVDCPKNTFVKPGTPNQPVAVVLRPKRERAAKKDEIKKQKPPKIFQAALKRWDVAQVNTLLSKGKADVEQLFQPDQQTALMLAAIEGHKVMVHTLLQHGASVVAKDQDGCTALYLAASNGNYEAVKILAQQQLADINIRNKPLLMEPVRKGFSMVTELLVQYGAKVDVESTEGETALHVAVRKGNFDVVKVLLDANSEFTRQSKKTLLTPLEEALQGDNTEIVRLLMKAVARVNEKSHNLFTCKTGDQVKHLIKKGAKVDTRNSDEATPLLVHVQQNNVEIVKELIKQRANFNLQDRRGYSALIVAAKNSSLELAQLLVKYGAILDLKEKSHGYTALMFAIENGHVRIVRELVLANANINQRNRDDKSSLDLAGERGNPDILEILYMQPSTSVGNDPFINILSAYMLEKGRAKRNSLLTPLEEAQQSDDTEISHNLFTCKTGDQVKRLIKKGAKVDTRNSDEATPLLVHVQQNNIEIVKELIQQRANVDLQDRRGYSALIVAAKNSSLELAQLLVKYGAILDLNEKSHGYTALMFAIENGHVRIVRELVLANANINRSSLDLAGELGNPDILEILNMQPSTSVGNDLFSNILWGYMLEKGGAKRNVLSKSLAIGSTESLPRSRANSSLKTAYVPEEDSAHTLEVKKYRKRSADLETRIHDLTILGTMKQKTRRELKEEKMWHSHDEATVQLLLDNYARVDSQQKVGMSPASQHGNLDVMKLLLSSKVDVILKDKNYALILTCKNGHTEVAELLLGDDAQVDMQTDDGMSALMWASQNGHTEVAKLLLDHHAQVDMQMNNGWSALMSASKHGHTEVVKLLLDHRAQGDLQDNNGWSALMLASKHGHTEVVKLLLDHRAQVDLQDNDGWSALMLASQEGHSEVAKLLLDDHAQVDMQDNDGWSALMYAVKCGNLKALQHLIVHGASTRLKISAGWTVFEIHPEKQKELLMMIIRTQQTPPSIINGDLRHDQKYPGLLLYNAPVIRYQTASSDCYRCMGISLYIHKHSPNFVNDIRPCFSGPFELPKEYEPASPAYLILHNEMHLQNNVTMRMNHYANLRSQEDCDCMTFLSASSTPEYRNSHPVYTFKEMLGSKGTFKPGDQVGEVSLQHFCLIITGKRKRDSEESSATSSKRHQGGNWYSARLYRSPNHEGLMSAVFCICLCDGIYIKHCDSIMKEKFSGELSWEFAQDVQDLVKVYSDDKYVIFDKTPAQILKKDIHIPETMDPDVVGYPPRLLITARTNMDFTSPKIHIEGLDRECGFNLFIQVSASSLSDENATKSNLDFVQEPSAAAAQRQPIGQTIAPQQGIGQSISLHQGTAPHQVIGQSTASQQGTVPPQIIGQPQQGTAPPQIIKQSTAPQQGTAPLHKIIQSTSQQNIGHTPVPKQNVCVSVQPTAPQQDVYTAGQPTAPQLGIYTAGQYTAPQQGAYATGQPTAPQQGVYAAGQPTAPQLSIYTAGQPTPPQQGFYTAGQPTPQHGVYAAGQPTAPQQGMYTAGQPTSPQHGVYATGQPIAPQQGIYTAGQPTSPQQGIYTAGQPTPPQQGIYTAGQPTAPQQGIYTAGQPTSPQQGVYTAGQSTAAQPTAQFFEGVAVQCPTLREFISFPMSSGRVNLAQRICRFHDFGIFLLEDDNGDRTEAIVREHRDSAEDINRNIFRLWVKGKGLKPVSWATLVDVLQDMGLYILARDIKQVKCSFHSINF